MLAKKTVLLLAAVVMMTLSFVSLAKERNIAIKLTKIEAVKTSERFGDKLYFSMSEYSNKGSPQLFRIPMFPLHWLDRELPRIKSVKLWEGKLDSDQSVLLVISLLEQDLEPWNSDDHIGSVQVKFFNKNGKVTSQWGQPKFVDATEVQQPNPNVPSYIMLGDGGKYKVAFKVETH